MLTFKQIERASKMFTDSINRHGDDLRTADFDWYVVELFDARYPEQLIQQLVPWCRLDFK
jgi:hypothetical protein